MPRPSPPPAPLSRAEPAGSRASWAAPPLPSRRCTVGRPVLQTSTSQEARGWPRALQPWPGAAEGHPPLPSPEKRDDRRGCPRRPWDRREMSPAESRRGLGGPGHPRPGRPRRLRLRPRRKRPRRLQRRRQQLRRRRRVGEERPRRTSGRSAALQPEALKLLCLRERSRDVVALVPQCYAQPLQGVRGETERQHLGHPAAVHHPFDDSQAGKRLALQSEALTQGLTDHGHRLGGTPPGEDQVCLVESP